MENKVITAKSVDELNALIKEHNDKGWVVKQIYAFGLRTTTLYALLERQLYNKEMSDYESGR